MFHKFKIIIIINIIITLTNLIITQQSCTEKEKHCIKCDKSSKLCKICENTAFIPDEEGGCKGALSCKVGLNYCEECNKDSNLCKSCDAGYIPDENGGCTHSPNCQISYHGECFECKTNFALIGSEGGIKFCKSLFSNDYQNCGVYNIKDGYCMKCNDDFFLNTDDKKCTETNNCAESIYTQCIRCSEGFYLDNKNNKQCKSNLNNSDFVHCIESEDGKKCSKCEDDFVLNKDTGKCGGTFLYCAQKKNDFFCEECEDNYILTNDKQACTRTNDCMTGDKNNGLCTKCMPFFYLDLNDMKCKDNRKDFDDLKYCEFFEEHCTKCEPVYFLGEDFKCSKTKYCKKSENGVCLECSDNYYLTEEKICTEVEHCIKSIREFNCDQCEEDFYYDKSQNKCLKSKDKFNNCKLSNKDGTSCEECNNNYYLYTKDNLCYSNKDKEEEGGVNYKCARKNSDNNKCEKCVEGFFLGSKDKKCSSIENCSKSEGGEKCLECEEFYCFDVKKGICIENDYIEEKENKIYYMCYKTNKEGTACETCLEDYTLNDKGLCVNYSDCEEEEDGVCIKCISSDGDYPYCLNKDFGCVEANFNENCLICDDFLDFDICTQCREGFELNEYDRCQ